MRVYVDASMLCAFIVSYLCVVKHLGDKGVATGDPPGATHGRFSPSVFFMV